MEHSRVYCDRATDAIAYRPQQAADLLGVSLSTLERITKADAIPTVKLGRCRVYLADQLKAWLASRQEGGRR
jgi:excisionase family DNA binding protein